MSATPPYTASGTLPSVLTSNQNLMPAGGTTFLPVGDWVEEVNQGNRTGAVWMLALRGAAEASQLAEFQALTIFAKPCLNELTHEGLAVRQSGARLIGKEVTSVPKTSGCVAPSPTPLR